VIVTGFPGMVKVVVSLFAFAKATPSADVHLSKIWPLGAALAVMATVAPCV